MKLIPLTQGKFVKVDDWWFDRLVAMGPWCYREKGGNSGYAATYTGGGRSSPEIVCMQNIVKTANPGETIDHINLDKLDNQEHNLRSATDSQQAVNRSTRADNKTSGIPGVSWDKTAKTWRVYTNKDGKRICLGLRKNLDEAIALRDQGVAEIHGEFARVFKSTGESVSVANFK